MTLSNMSHIVHITFFGETDGVTLLRLGCTWDREKALQENWGIIDKNVTLKCPE